MPFVLRSKYQVNTIVKANQVTSSLPTEQFSDHKMATKSSGIVKLDVDGLCAVRSPEYTDHKPTNKSHNVGYSKWPLVILLSLGTMLVVVAVVMMILYIRGWMLCSTEGMYVCVCVCVCLKLHTRMSWRRYIILLNIINH